MKLSSETKCGIDLCHYFVFKVTDAIGFTSIRHWFVKTSKRFVVE